MPTDLRSDLLRLICAQLPAKEAAYVASLAPDDYEAHVEAYCAVRRLGVELAPGLLDEFVLSLLAYLDSTVPPPQEAPIPAVRTGSVGRIHLVAPRRPATTIR